MLKAHPRPENDYEPVLALAKERGVGVIAMKAVAKRAGSMRRNLKGHNGRFEEVQDLVSTFLTLRMRPLVHSHNPIRPPTRHYDDRRSR